MARKKAAKPTEEATGPAVQIDEGDNDLQLLHPDPQNPREITPEARDGLSVSMQEFGDLSVITFNLRTGELVCGHQRVAELRAAGARSFVRLPGAGPGTDVARGYVDHPRTGERFDVRFVDWTRERQQQANLVANSRAISGTFTDGVESLLSAFQASDPDLFLATRMDVLTMFEPHDVQIPEEAQPPPLVEEDEVPEVDEQGEPDSKVGEVYGLGVAVQCACCGEWVDLTEEEAAALYREHGIDPTRLNPDGTLMDQQ